MRVLGKASDQEDLKTMLRQKSRATCAALVAVALSLSMGAATSSAAKEPASFYGVASQTNLGAADFARMGQGKVGALRIIVNWSAIDPTAAAGDNNWSSVDPLVFEAANKALDNQKCKGAKCVIYAPKTAAGLAAWGTFVGEFVDRYGENGVFWTGHPEVPKNPIDVIQVWNEQNSESFFAPKPGAKA